MQITLFYLFLMTFPHMSLHCKLAPVQYQEYKYGLFNSLHLSDSRLTLSSNSLSPFSEWLPLRIYGGVRHPFLVFFRQTVLYSH